MKTVPGDATPYHVLRVVVGNEYGLPAGDYRVNDKGEIVYLVGLISDIHERRHQGAASHVRAHLHAALAQLVRQRLEVTVVSQRDQLDSGSHRRCERSGSERRLA